MAEDAEDCSPGRVPGTGGSLLFIHAFKVFVGPVERSLRGAPRPLECHPCSPRRSVAVEFQRLWPLDRGSPLSALPRLRV